MIDLDELERLANAATPGPWIEDYTDHRIPYPFIHGPLSKPKGQLGVQLVVANLPISGREIHDMAFIAAARTAVPQLVARVRELEALLRKAEWTENPHGYGGWCLWCLGNPDDGHHPACPWQAAMGTGGK